MNKFESVFTEQELESLNSRIDSIVAQKDDYKQLHSLSWLVNARDGFVNRIYNIHYHIDLSYEIDKLLPFANSHFGEPSLLFKSRLNQELRSHNTSSWDMHQDYIPLAKDMVVLGICCTDVLPGDGIKILTNYVPRGKCIQPVFYYDSLDKLDSPEAEMLEFYYPDRDRRWYRHHSLTMQNYDGKGGVDENYSKRLDMDRFDHHAMIMESQLPVNQTWAQLYGKAGDVLLLDGWEIHTGSWSPIFNDRRIQWLLYVPEDEGETSQKDYHCWRIKRNIRKNIEALGRPYTEQDVENAYKIIMDRFFSHV